MRRRRRRGWRKESASCASLSVTFLTGVKKADYQKHPQKPCLRRQSETPPGLIRPGGELVAESAISAFPAFYRFFSFCEDGRPSFRRPRLGVRGVESCCTALSLLLLCCSLPGPGPRALCLGLKPGRQPWAWGVFPEPRSWGLGLGPGAWSRQRQSRTGECFTAIFNKE